jgi:hypothetical protein
MPARSAGAGPTSQPSAVSRSATSVVEVVIRWAISSTPT